MKTALYFAALAAVTLTLTGCEIKVYPANSKPDSTAVTETAADTSAAAESVTESAAQTAAAEATAAPTAPAATAAPATDSPAPAETKAAETKAAETKAPETVPAETKPAETAAPSAENDGWKAAYKETLRNFRNSAETAQDAGWDLQDLDQDGTPELLIAVELR